MQVDSLTACAWITSLLRDEMKAIGLGQTALMRKGYIPAPSSAGSSCCMSVPSKGSSCSVPGFHLGLGEDTDLHHDVANIVRTQVSAVLLDFKVWCLPDGET